MEVVAPPVKTDELAIVRYCREHELEVLEVGSVGSWPFTDDAIIQFEENIYAYVDSYVDKTIVDPFNGESRRSEYYGQVIAWASYNASKKPQKSTVASPDRQYIALPHETTYSVAMKLRHHGFTESEFIEHNGIVGGSLEAGKVYHLPLVEKRKVPEPATFYEILDKPKLFHITRPGGAQKWAFGNARKVKDIISGSGMYPENKEVEVAALAYVPLGAETFVYAMDTLALGAYESTGKVKYMIGWGHADLSPGAAPKKAAKKVKPPSPTIAQQIQDTIAAIEPIPVPTEPLPPRPDDVLKNPDAWRGTVVWYDEPITYIIDLPDGQTELLIHDYLQKGPSRRVLNNGHYSCTAEFTKDGVTYALPTECVRYEDDGTRRIKNYYGLPIEILTSAVELYQMPIDLQTKQAMHNHLTLTEKVVIPTFALTRLSYDRLKLYGQNLKQRITNR